MLDKLQRLACFADPQRSRRREDTACSLPESLAALADATAVTKKTHFVLAVASPPRATSTFGNDLSRGLENDSNAQAKLPGPHR